MWGFDIYGNARNAETEDKIDIMLGPDGLSRVYFNGKNIGAFRSHQDAVNFVKDKVEELESSEK